MTHFENLQLVNNKLAVTELFVSVLRNALFGDENKVMRGMLDAIRTQLCDVQNDVTTIKNKLGQCGVYHVNEDERAAASQFGKLRAIKMVRERLGLGLKDAKDLVEKEITDFGPKF